MRATGVNPATPLRPQPPRHGLCCLFILSLVHCCDWGGLEHRVARVPFAGPCPQQVPLSSPALLLPRLWLDSVSWGYRLTRNPNTAREGGWFCSWVAQAQGPVLGRGQMWGLGFCPHLWCWWDQPGRGTASPCDHNLPSSVCAITSCNVNYFPSCVWPVQRHTEKCFKQRGSVCLEHPVQTRIQQAG